MAQTSTAIEMQRDDTASRMGMWLFIVAELMLFGTLFVLYSVIRFEHSTAFHLASQELDIKIGALSTAILLISSATLAISVSTLQMDKKKLSLMLLGATGALALVFMAIKYYEWSTLIQHQLYPGSPTLADFGEGDALFFGFYFFTTGIHALHVIIGIVFLAIVIFKVKNDTIHKTHFAQLETKGLYWHLIGLVWIFIFPILYLIN